MIRFEYFLLLPSIRSQLQIMMQLCFQCYSYSNKSLQKYTFCIHIVTQFTICLIINQCYPNFIRWKKRFNQGKIQKLNNSTMKMLFVDYNSMVYFLLSIPPSSILCIYIIIIIHSLIYSLSNLQIEIYHHISKFFTTKSQKNKIIFQIFL